MAMAAEAPDAYAIIHEHCQISVSQQELLDSLPEWKMCPNYDFTPSLAPEFSPASSDTCSTQPGVLEGQHPVVFMSPPDSNDQSFSGMKEEDSFNGAFESDRSSSPRRRNYDDSVKRIPLTESLAGSPTQNFTNTWEPITGTQTQGFGDRLKPIMDIDFETQNFDDSWEEQRQSFGDRTKPIIEVQTKDSETQNYEEMETQPQKFEDSGKIRTQGQTQNSEDSLNMTQTTADSDDLQAFPVVDVEFCTQLFSESPAPLASKKKSNGEQIFPSVPSGSTRVLRPRKAREMSNKLNLSSNSGRASKRKNNRHYEGATIESTVKSKRMRGAVSMEDLIDFENSNALALSVVHKDTKITDGFHRIAIANASVILQLEDTPTSSKCLVQRQANDPISSRLKEMPTGLVHSARTSSDACASPQLFEPQGNISISSQLKGTPTASVSFQGMDGSFSAQLFEMQADCISPQSQKTTASSHSLHLGEIPANASISLRVEEPSDILQPTNDCESVPSMQKSLEDKASGSAIGPVSPVAEAANCCQSPCFNLQYRKLPLTLKPMHKFEGTPSLSITYKTGACLQRKESGDDDGPSLVSMKKPSSNEVPHAKVLHSSGMSNSSRACCGGNSQLHEHLLDQEGSRSKEQANWNEELQHFDNEGTEENHVVNHPNEVSGREELKHVPQMDAEFELSQRLRSPLSFTVSEILSSVLRVFCGPKEKIQIDSTTTMNKEAKKPRKGRGMIRKKRTEKCDHGIVQNVENNTDSHKFLNSLLSSGYMLPHFSDALS